MDKQNKQSGKLMNDHIEQENAQIHSMKCKIKQAEAQPRSRRCVLMVHLCETSQENIFSFCFTPLSIH